MRVRQVSDRAIFWSLGRGDGEELIGVEVSLEGEEGVRRRIIRQGKYGKERTLFEERYLVDEYKGILRSEFALISSFNKTNKDLTLAIMEAIESLRRVYERL
ncbi:MAG: hypothetical protein ACUVQ5_03190 [Candidatus Methanomethylicaceae archaeon]